MKILHVISSMDPAGGGLAQALRCLIPVLRDLGTHSSVVCLDAQGESYGTSDGFEIIKLGPGKSAWQYAPTLRPWLREHLSEYDAVVIHGLWQYHAYAVTQEIKLLRQSGKREPRVFVMSHGMLDPWFQRDKLRQVKAWRNWLYWKLIERHTIANADGVLFTCQKELELAREPFRPYRPKREMNIGLGVAEPPPFNESMRIAFQSACSGLGEKPYLLFLSRIHPKKGVDLLIEAYANGGFRNAAFRSAKVAEEEENNFAERNATLHNFAERNIAKLDERATKHDFAERKATMERNDALPDLVIAGPTDSEYAQSMMRLVAERGLSERVHFPGMLQGDAKWGAFYGCDAFVLPSHQENFGIAVVEALACGKPVLISNQINIYSDIEADGAAIVSDDTLVGTMQMLDRWLGCSDHERQAMSGAADDCYRKRYRPLAAAERLLQALGRSEEQ